ncbi:MAG: Hpt domain-containing protein [Phycisphaerales bacterium]|nr:MAG: Hpt domain-containing protein [Phycisphaerales bacterium]
MKFLPFGPNDRLDSVDISGMEERARPNEGSQSDAPLLSEYAGDADMVELITYFVGEMNNRVQSIEKAWQEQDKERLRDYAHQIKGAAAGYGFPQITDSAAKLERELNEEATIADLSERVEALIGLCRRATASPDGK